MTTTLPIFVALIGLAGALIGAAAGLLGNRWAVRQQTDRTERNSRGQVYSDFLEAVRGGHSAVLRRDAIQGAFDANELVVGLKSGILDPLLWRAHTEKLDDVAARLHRLHLVAHPMAYEAALEIYRVLGTANGVSMDQDPELHHDINVQFYTAIAIFTDVARADTQAPGHEQIWTYTKNLNELRLDGDILLERARGLN